MIPEQLGMFNEAEAEQDHKAPEPTEETLTAKPVGRLCDRIRVSTAVNVVTGNVVIKNLYSQADKAVVK